MIDNPLKTINVLVRLFEPTQKKLNFLIKSIKEEQDKYFMLSDQLMKEQNNIQNDKNRQDDKDNRQITQDIEESFKKEGKVDKAASKVQKYKRKKKEDKKQKSISKFQNSLIKTHQRFGNRLKKIIFYNEISEESSDNQLNHLIESSDCEYPIIDEMAKVIEEGKDPINPDYLIYLIGIDVYNPQLEQLFKNEFYSSAMKSINILFEKMNNNINEDVDSDNKNVQNNIQFERKNLQKIICQYYNKNKLQIIIQLKVLLKLSGRIWVIQKHSLAKILTSKQVQSSLTSNNLYNQKDSFSKMQDERNIIITTKVSKSQKIDKNKIKSAEDQLEEMRQKKMMSNKPMMNQNKKYQCKFCEKYFKQKWSIDEHLRSYHPAQEIEQIYMDTEDQIVDKDELFDEQQQIIKRQQQ